MTFADVTQFAADYWKDAIQIALLAVAIYYTWNFFKGTPGANVLMGLVTIFLGFGLDKFSKPRPAIA